MQPVSENPIKTIITIDGGYTNVVVEEAFPSSTIAFFQFGVLFFKYEDLLELERKPFIDPDDFAKIQNIQRLKLVIPTKGVSIKGQKDLISSVRKALYDFFMSAPDKKEDKTYMQSLKWFLFEEYSLNAPKPWHLATCPYCSKGLDIECSKISRSFTTPCPFCGGEIYLTDVFRLHEAIDNELGAGGILGYITTTVEQMTIVFLIHQILNLQPSLLKSCLIIKDGPLAFFGQTANMYKPMRSLVRFLHKKHAIYLVGLEKSGAFVEHAAQISERMKPKQFLMLGNKHIYKYIIPGTVEEHRPYADTSYYSSKLIFKSVFENVYVATIPNIYAKVEPTRDDYLNLDVILHNITALKCDLYYNSLVPVVMVNKLVSLADHPSSDVLRSFAQENIQH
ncbi:MAG TPA: NurA domain-containing protein [Synergistaceae bacterium]|nr:NurA domain-containing protein [Synergistaceae bacterium]